MALAAPWSATPSATSWAGGSGVVVLPCGAGKTIVGAAAMARAYNDWLADYCSADTSRGQTRTPPVSLADYRGRSPVLLALFRGLY